MLSATLTRIVIQEAPVERVNAPDRVPWAATTWLWTYKVEGLDTFVVRFEYPLPAVAVAVALDATVADHNISFGQSVVPDVPELTAVDVPVLSDALMLMSSDLSDGSPDHSSAMIDEVVLPRLPAVITWLVAPLMLQAPHIST